tara:strand:+ start:1951 stop:2268 length:318 start_codon:yes stop_codon:yes gene_type:complete
MSEPSVDDYWSEATMVIAMSVRNHMEDFHCAHLSDEQMKELNPIIRQGVLHGVLALNDPNRRDELRWLRIGVPSYWEKPIDTHAGKDDDYKNFLDMFPQYREVIE